MALMYRTTHNLAEPAGSLALAALLAEKDLVAGRRVAVVHTGGNADFGVLAGCFETVASATSSTTGATVASATSSTTVGGKT